MANSKFKRKKEDFACVNCNQFVIGDGYTNHCPNCLWSIHIDVFPGDRKSSCLGAMKPEEIIKEGGTFSLVHKCVSCGLRKKNKISDADNFENLVKVSTIHTS